MSDKELTDQFNRVEKSRADTWGFLVFMATMALIGWLNS